MPFVEPHREWRWVVCSSCALPLFLGGSNGVGLPPMPSAARCHRCQITTIYRLEDLLPRSYWWGVIPPAGGSEHHRPQSGKAFIYAIRNRHTDKAYIGQTSCSMGSRWESHVQKARSRSKNYPRSLFQQDLGADIKAFSMQLIEECLLDERFVVESNYIRELDTWNPEKGYNYRPGATRHLFGNMRVKTRYS